MENGSGVKLIVILGPTACGKTQWGIELAKEWNGEVISADSRQIYMQMDIGTGKPRGVWNTELGESIYRVGGVPHHLMDFLEPSQVYSSAEFKQDALEKIRHIQERSHLPFLVGGTGMYIQALIDNLEIPKVPPQIGMRTELEKQSLDELIQLLQAEDPESAQRIDRKNKRRIIRALEVTRALHGSFVKYQRKGPPLFTVLLLGIEMPRAELYARIDRRVVQMVSDGLVEETQQLLSQYDPSRTAMSGIGYFEIGEYLRGVYTLPEAIKKIQYRTHSYARRQMTWFRKDKRIIWVRDLREARGLISHFVQK